MNLEARRLIIKKALNPGIGSLDSGLLVYEAN